ncbi:Dam family site-specific DNA-(adenine-N6)-methyltransferase [Escherichia coli]|uniref:Dam family site-specific DNA-(adenine-N6)-methyltransferase n=1 Tax=Escherichia coli TaxID=562 RepID=UPI002FE2E51D
MKELCYGSVCSGIEAASIAWEPLGMRPAWFAEIEPFPSAVLAHRWPHVANLGDMTKLAKKVLAGEIESPDVLVGGTPCQAFSIAGLRGGLDDERGALTLKYVELANAIDDKRAESFLKPTVIVWENVPGVLSSADNAFGCFLAGLAGEDAPFEPGDRPESGKSNAFWRWDGKTGCHAPKWPQCGCIYGPQRKVAWRILDAQYFGVAQRRRRVFVVASARTDLDPATVLFEFEGVRRNIAPSRKKKEIASAIIANGAAISGESLNPCLYDDLHRAAAFLFLNRHCFNGLTRYNQAGEFNVGYGKYKTPYFPLQEMEAFLGAEGRSEFVCGDFAAVIEAAGEGDVIFCDPPYEPLPNTEGFTNYSGHDFKFEEQKRLVSLLTDAHRRGAKVLITNSGAPNIRELYHDNGFRVEPLFARRSVSCKGDTRGVAHDVLGILL